MKKLLYFSLFLWVFSACKDGDDDAGMPLIYTICSTEFTFSDTDRMNIKTLPTSEISNSIRTHIATEFAGFEIVSALSFEVNSGTTFIEVTANNNGKLLFDDTGSFICGDESFALSSGDEYIDIDALPQKIKDYIAENHPNTSIEEAEIEDGEYEVKLNNGKELYFDLEGNFLREE